MDPIDRFSLISRDMETLMRAFESWPLAHQMVFGPGGALRQRLTPNEYAAFRQSDHYLRLLGALANIRAADDSKQSRHQAEKVLFLRIPTSLHGCLVIEARTLNLSLNQLGITKLLTPADNRLIPDFEGRPRGRKPGPQSQRGMRDLETVAR